MEPEHERVAVKTARRRPARRRAGFSLLEVMIALVILAFGLLALAMMQAQALKEGSKSRHHTRAAMIARDQIEQIQRAPFSQVNNVAWGAAPAWMAAAGLTVGPVNMQVTSPDGVFTEQTYTVAWQVTPVAGQPQLRNVDVEVTWTENDGFDGTRPTRTGLPTVAVSSIIVDNDR